MFLRNVCWLIKGLHGVTSVITVADRKSDRLKFYFLFLLRLRGPTSRQYEPLTKIPTAQAPYRSVPTKRGPVRITEFRITRYPECWMWGSHAAGYETYCVLRSDAMSSGRSPLGSRRNWLPEWLVLRPWKWRQYFPAKHIDFYLTTRRYISEDYIFRFQFHIRHSE